MDHRRTNLERQLFLLRLLVAHRMKMHDDLRRRACFYRMATSMQRLWLNVWVSLRMDCCVPVALVTRRKTRSKDCSKGLKNWVRSQTYRSKESVPPRGGRWVRSHE